MKNLYRACVIFLLGMTLVEGAFAGNEDRRGTSGAGTLRINPWARSAGWGGVNTACGKGLDALFTNPAGLGRAVGTEILFSYTNWLNGTGIGVNSLGLSQSLGEESGVLGLSVTAMSFGDIPITRVHSPEVETNGEYRINLMNIGLSYARKFSESIYGGASLKLVSESINNLGATGFALDAGVQYVTGDNYEIKFGIALRNWGTPMSYGGDGNTTLGTSEESSSPSLSVQQRSQNYELPSSLNIGISYDFLLGEDQLHRITLAGNFAASAFGEDQFIAGAEYGFSKYLMVRAGFVYERDLFKDVKDVDGANTMMSGPTAGVSIMSPIGKEKDGKAPMNMALDYAYRFTRMLGGIHTIGLSLSL